jgi:peptidoglycan hydrolase CwlO-like protein
MSTTAAEMSWDDIKAIVAELAIQSKETDRKFQETERMIKELGRQIAALNGDGAAAQEALSHDQRQCAPWQP